MKELIHPPKSRAGDAIAILSPSLPGPVFGPEIHEQAMRRLTEATGLIPVEYPSTRNLRATPAQRAADITAALTDPAVTAIIATMGGDDQVSVIGHLDPDVVSENPTTFLGYSDNTHLHHLLRSCGIVSYYGGSTQVHLGPGPAIDPIHLRSLRAALIEGGKQEIIEPGDSEDFGIEWSDPAALTSHGRRLPTEQWRWSGTERVVTGETWGGCLESLVEVFLADRLGVTPTDIDGSILLIEMSEELTAPRQILRILRALGERGILGAVGAVLFARPPASTFDFIPPDEVAAQMRSERYDIVCEFVSAYNPEAVIVCGVPFGHTKPQWILPHGGRMTVDAHTRKIWAEYS